MKKIILFSLAAVVLAACGTGNRTVVTIRSKNYPVDNIELTWRDTAGVTMHYAVAISRGRGKAELDLPEGARVALVSQDPAQRIEIPGDEAGVPAPEFTFYAEHGRVDIEFDNTMWPAATIAGGRLNNDLNRLWAQLGPLEKRAFESTRGLVAAMLACEEIVPDPEAAAIANEQAGAIDGFIAENPDSDLSLELLSAQFIASDIDRLEPRFLALSERVRATPAGVALGEKLAKARLFVVGSPAPVFTKTDMKGNTIALTELRGKWVLLDFWATWCGPCRASHPHLVEIHNKYSPDGLVVINIAQEDGNDPEWREKLVAAIEKDGLVWTNIADNEHPEQGSIVSDYQVSAFPTKVLVDPEGRLAAIVVGGNVDDKLREIFGK